MPDAAARPDASLFCTFRLGDRWFGVDARWVKEINTHTHVTPIPHAPSVVEGFVNLRGHLFLVLNLSELLAPEAACRAGAGQLIVFQRSAGESLALLVDVVGEMVPVAADQIDLLEGDDDADSRQATGGASAGRLVTGVAKRSEGLVTIVDPRQFLAALAAGPGKPGARHSSR
jgi:purine-binding chemotaxis protein CheW